MALSIIVYDGTGVLSPKVVCARLVRIEVRLVCVAASRSLVLVFNALGAVVGFG